MFAKACKLAQGFTFPVISSIRLVDGSVSCSLAAFVPLNEDGWVLTTAHLWDSWQAFTQHQNEAARHDEESKRIELDATLTVKQKRKQLARLRPNPKCIMNHSWWWGVDSMKLAEVQLLKEADLVVARLEPWKPDLVGTYPTLKDPSRNMDPGTSLCKAGFPFHSIQATYDEAKKTFVLQEGAIPCPLFPIEGIYTRDAFAGKSGDGKYDLLFLETSSPGLRGQSGGPIFDTKGTVWALQCSTQSLALGFHPTIKSGGREVQEHQFINVGLGVHCQVIASFLRDLGISFQISDY